MSKVTVAVVQDSPVVFDLDATLAKVAVKTAEAAATGAELVLFPEAFVSAYPKGLDFGARMGMRLPEGRRDFRRYFESSVQAPGPATEALGRAARENRVHLVVGVIERDLGTLYCTVLFFGPDGALLGKHRKLMPTALERLVWGFGDGSTLPVLDTPLGKLGAVICWENYMPLLRFYMYSQGVQIYCAPTADDRDTWLPSMRHIALEGRCFVLSCCQYLLRKDCPEDYAAIQGDDPEEVLMRGGSCIVGPMGQVLAGPEFSGPAILSAELDLDLIPEGKYDFDAAGHYARPDVFQLQVNLRAAPAVSAWRGEPRDPFGDPE
ncbi:MAG: carbon-nitrogen hydrolase family protein [Desulfarculaceae bacterium]|nr:carbon-nitrogen hydrolase family protein [Desulfarculaceae bacterium]MCF8071449.1 carbon-nitrogen hydrolase family protein [Desulfarculaceae bacterium]MCF8103423.1 carbon-nitrogen hydrolase family protein [Desulfarculaceae bacterium]MCF8117836.1 carbon-nitrogen hydrolase family protein [Desulfarculaceae bacterium]